MKTKYFLLFILSFAVGMNAQAGKWGRNLTVAYFQTIDENGIMSVSYLSRTGAVWTGGTQSTVVTNYLKTKVGKYIVSSKNATFYGKPKNSSARYHVVQIYEDCAYKSGSAKFTARVYKGAYVTVGSLNPYH